MSGGVDSSVAALLLKQQGYDLVGVYMKPWQPKGFACLWEQDRSDALRVATQLDIPFETWDFSREYARHVSRPMVRGYREGRTPNPDVECNRHIKFGYFYKKARARGADAIATGHYARVGVRGSTGKLLTAADTSKDQTYFLWGLQKRHLARVLFPIGGLLKSRVRAIAHQAQLLTASKKDSQGVCFVGPLDMKSFLLSEVKSKRGNILHVDGRILGSHDGAAYYTVGQRHGLDIKDGAGPYFVVSKNMKRNTITVGSQADLMRTVASISNIHWIGERPKPGKRLVAKIRYRTPSVPVRISGSRVIFARPVQAVAPGQSIVFYEGASVVGGALLK
jgi:tRNA-specific 2-thiouridylase